MSPRTELINILKYSIRIDEGGDPSISHPEGITDTIMDMVDDKYGHLLGKDNE